METNWLKNYLFAFGNWVDLKIRTKSGRLTLLILGSLAVGGSVAVAYNKTTNYDAVEKDKLFYKAKSDTLQRSINTLIEHQEERCNEKQLQSAILQQQLKDIYNGKTQDNNDYAERQEAINRQREQVINLQEKKIKQLKTLTNE